MPQNQKNQIIEIENSLLTPSLGLLRANQSEGPVTPSNFSELR